MGWAQGYDVTCPSFLYGKLGHMPTFGQCDAVEVTGATPWGEKNVLSLSISFSLHGWNIGITMKAGVRLVWGHGNHMGKSNLHGHLVWTTMFWQTFVTASWTLSEPSDLLTTMWSEANWVTFSSVEKEGNNIQLTVLVSGWIRCLVLTRVPLSFSCHHVTCLKCYYFTLIPWISSLHEAPLILLSVFELSPLSSWP